MKKFTRFEIKAFILGCLCVAIGIWSLYMNQQSKLMATAADLESQVAIDTAVEPSAIVTPEVTEASTAAVVATSSPVTATLPPIEVETKVEPDPKAESAPKVEPKKVAPVVTAPVVVPPVEPETKVDLSVATVSSGAMLRAHNNVRLDHGLSPFTWSNKLAVSAQGWSDKLKTESCKMRHDQNTPYGENIYWESLIGGGVDVMISTDQDPVIWWANEEKFYNYDKNTCRPGEQCGHYTQIVWADTTEVGCGVSSCIVGEERRDLWVCRYNPPGNYEGMQPY